MPFMNVFFYFICHRSARIAPAFLDLRLGAAAAMAERFQFVSVRRRKQVNKAL